jgi:hypothetical protein
MLTAATQGPLSPLQVIDYQACMWQCSGSATDAECDYFCRQAAISMPSTLTPGTGTPTAPTKKQLIPGVENEYLLLAAGIIAVVLIVR